MTVSLMTVSISGLYATFGIEETEQNESQHNSNECCCAEFHTVNILSVTFFTVMLRVFFNVLILSCKYAECPYTEYHFTECHYAEYNYAECHYTELSLC